MNQNLSKEVQLAYAGAAVGAANNTDDNSTIFDMANWEGVMFVTTITDSVTSGVATLKAEGNSANSDSGMAAITGASAAKTCASSDDINGKTLVLDVCKPQYRYVQAVRTSSAANIAFGEVHAILYGPKKQPVTAHSTNATSALSVG